MRSPLKARHLSAAFASIAVSSVLVVFPATVPAGAAGTVNLYTYAGSPGISGPDDIAVDASGNMWFTNAVNNTIGEITTAGAVTIYTDASIDNPHGIALGSDGALWFTNYDSDSIGRITTAGVVTNYPDTTGTVDDPEGITAGPDGNLYFTDYMPVSGSYYIGQIVPSTGTITTFTNASLDMPYGITTGPDGNLWITNVAGGTSSHGSVSKMTTSGSFTTYNDTSINGPYGITTGGDYNLWFTNYGGASGTTIDSISTSGTVTTYTLPMGVKGPHSITEGPDYSLWFTAGGPSGTSYVGRIDGSTHTITKYAESTMGNPHGIVTGADGQLWFTNHGTNNIGSASTDYSVVSSVRQGGPSTSVTITGAGFSSGETVTLTYNVSSGMNTNVCSTSPTVAADGTFSCSGSIPSSAGSAGIHTIKAVGGTSGITAKTLFLLT
jgi:streptogramin lyase